MQRREIHQLQVRIGCRGERYTSYRYRPTK